MASDARSRTSTSAKSAIKNRRDMADTLLYPCGSHAPCRRSEGSRANFVSGIPGPSRTYPELFAVLGGQVPDLRGLFLRGHGGNSAALGTRQGYAMKDFLGHGELEVSFGGTLNGSGIFKYLNNRIILAPAASWGPIGSSSYGIDLSAGGLPVSNEVRPDNMAVRYLVRSRP